MLAKTAAFTTIVLTELGKSIASRSENANVWRLKSNRWLPAALTTSLALQLIVVYTPLSTLFNTTYMPLPLWLYGLMAAAMIMAVDELRKMLNIRI